MAHLTIGLVYETFETYPFHSGDPVDAHVEFEPESTIEALAEAISSLGHRPLRLGSPRDLLARLSERGTGAVVQLGVDVAFNLAEGMGSRNREAWAPVLLEMAGIPTLGSDALSLSLSLDKSWANRWVAAAGLSIAAQCEMSDAEEAERADLPAPFPLFVKPRWEGTAKGIRASSRVESRVELAREVERVVRDYAQPALVEAFVSGPEYTVTLVGNDPPRAWPTVQRALERETRIGIHALEGPGAGKHAGELVPLTEGVLEPALEARLSELAVRAFEALGCHDFARVDFRLDATGEPIFLEINPLPTFATDGTFAILAELEGCSLSEMLARCIQAGLDRLALG
ncbi:MAG: D-alanine--D-alanine ligase [Deltaproteobacteria bacterium]|nr:D-alanine--D-alanine ligase [Deltaproteobacteria bacterium]